MLRLYFLEHDAEILLFIEDQVPKSVKAMFRTGTREV